MKFRIGTAQEMPFQSYFVGVGRPFSGTGSKTSPAKKAARRTLTDDELQRVFDPQAVARSQAETET
jgi:hypothetical protein